MTGPAATPGLLFCVTSCARVTDWGWEEAGLRFEPQTLQLVHVSHRLATDERLTFFFRPASDLPIGQPRNREPDKCDDMRWFPINELPLNTVSYVRDALHHILSNVPYSEFGWSVRGN